MRVAAEVMEDGMSCKGELLTFLSDFIAENEITKVIETGTYMGTGSTMAIIEGLTRHGKEFEFHSIEVNPEHHRMATQNVPKLNGVTLHLGLSVGRGYLPDKVAFRGYPKDVIVDHQPKDRKEKYLQEVSYDVPDNVLERIIQDMTPELVLLDSAGHMGWIEYEYLMARMKGKKFYLVLDDTNHVKHYKSAKDVKSKYPIIFETEDKFGGLCAEIS